MCYLTAALLLTTAEPSLVWGLPTSDFRNLVQAEATAHATIISETLESCWISRRFLRLRTGCTTL